MLILGINGGFRPSYQDAAACLVENGKLLAAVEEERLSRVKFAPGKLPYLSILEVLKIAEKKIADIDLIAFHGSTWEHTIEKRIAEYFQNYFGYAPPVRRFHHHDCHAASAFFASGFKEALIVTLDNSGDGVSLQIALGVENKIELLKRYYRPDSFGIFYSLITQYCGFNRDADEYKLMGLSSYGNRNAYDFSWLIGFENEEFRINRQFIKELQPSDPSPHRDEMLFSDAFVHKMKNRRRVPKTEINNFYKDVAASAQQHFENEMLKIVLHYCNKTGSNNVCLAGGSALNCLMNQKLMNAPGISNIFIQPVAGDAGISMGAAWLAGLEMSISPQVPDCYYTGAFFSNNEIKTLLDAFNIKYDYTENPAWIAAEFIAENKVIGWFQGRAEYGPRALGNRSILANACNPQMQKIVNEKIKFREGFRPFCPSVLEEYASLYFEGKQFPAPYMIITYDTKPEIRNKIPSVVHVDGTARIQTVNEKQNPKFHELLTHLKKLTGHGIALNTSFNLSHEPMVYHPQHALATFFSSGIDVLFIENYIIRK